MEKSLEDIMVDIMTKPEVYGCVFADHQGLCLGVKGKATTESAGIIGALAEQVRKLEPKSRMPVIYLENDNRACLIHRSGTVTGAIFKNVHS